MTEHKNGYFTCPDKIHDSIGVTYGELRTSKDDFANETREQEWHRFTVNDWGTVVIDNADGRPSVKLSSAAFEALRALFAEAEEKFAWNSLYAPESGYQHPADKLLHITRNPKPAPKPERSQKEALTQAIDQLTAKRDALLRKPEEAKGKEHHPANSTHPAVEAL